MAIVTQGITDWPGTNGKLTSDSSLKLRFSKSSRDEVRGF